MQIEIRNAGKEAHISGYVNAVERDSRVLPKKMSEKADSDFVERVTAGAFAKAVAANPNIRMLFNHNRDREIGSTAAGTLKLSEDAIGLRAEAVITDPEVVAVAQRGELRGWSFGFFDAVDRWEPFGEIQRRSLDGFSLDEVSVLTKIPAYFGTSVEVRSLDNPEPCTAEHRSIEDTSEITSEPEDWSCKTNEYRKTIAELYCG